MFDEQYTLTTYEEIQVRYRTETRTDTWTDSDGNAHSDSYTVEVPPYDYYILHVTLKNKDISIIASNNLTTDQYEMFKVIWKHRVISPIYLQEIFMPPLTRVSIQTMIYRQMH